MNPIFEYTNIPANLLRFRLRRFSLPTIGLIILMGREKVWQAHQFTGVPALRQIVESWKVMDNFPKWPSGDDTIELLAQVRNGKEHAIDDLLERHRNSLRRMIQLRLDQRIQNRVDVSDVVQDVLVEANRRLSNYLENPVMGFQVWLRQIAKDRIIDAHRRHRASAKRSVDREQSMVAQGGQDHSTLELVNRLCDPGLTPAAMATKRKSRRRLNWLFASSRV